MTYGSICSGIEAATVAWHPLDWKPAFFAEIEPFPCAVLAHHYPGVPNLGDFTRIQPGAAEPIDLLVGGTPCQSFSVAGKRLGLDDPRGNLTIEWLRLVQRLVPRWVVWENVPGVLSDDGGRTFGTILGTLAKLGYGFAYRVLDAQFFGLAQRRKRVFLVGRLGDWRAPAAVLLEPEGMSGHPAPSREAGAQTAALTSNGVGTCGADDNQAQAGHLIAGQCHGSNVGEMGALRRSSGSVTGGVPFVAHSLRAEGFDASEDGTGRGIPLVAHALNAKGGAGRTDGESETFVVHGRQDPITSREQTGPLDCDPGSQEVIAFNMRGRDDGAHVELAPGNKASLRSTAGGSSRTYVADASVRRLTPRECERLQGFPDDYSFIPGWSKRLDEISLQKIAADMVAYWMRAGYHGEDLLARIKTPDGPRYKALGNSMAVPCMRWIGERIAFVDSLSEAA